jgi:TolB-like protein
LVDLSHRVRDRLVDAGIPEFLGGEAATVERAAHLFGRRSYAGVERGRPLRTRYVEIPVFHYRLRRVGAAGSGAICGSARGQSAEVPSRFTDRLRKFMRRNKTVVGVTATAVAAILATIGYTLHRETVTQAKIAANAVTVLAPTQASARATAHSVAVLPFVDMSEKKDQEYFSDGLSEELIELLGKTPGLRVIARTSSFYFKGRAEKLEAIAAELRVANVLEGSVRKSGNKLRVTAQLIRADTSEHLWSETFDRELTDIFKVQDEIAGAVVTALKVHLLPAVQDELRTENIEAYNQYLRGRENYNRGDTDGYRRAVTAFSAATVLDPRYAAAYADLALAEYWLADAISDKAGYQPGCNRAVAAAEKAVALAPGLAAGYSARGIVRAPCRLDFAGAQADLDKAVALSPGDANVLHRSAVLLAILGNLPAAIAREEKAPSGWIRCRRRSLCALRSSSLQISSWGRLGHFMRRRLRSLRTRLEHGLTWGTWTCWKIGRNRHWPPFVKPDL